MNEGGDEVDAVDDDDDDVGNDEEEGPAFRNSV